MTLVDGLTVLVIEDHDFQRRTMARMLRSLGVRDVLEAANGNQALAFIRGVTVDLIVCDLNMPEMDGMELIRHLGQINRAIAVIICSAQNRALLDSVEKMAVAYGVRLLGVIEKPVTVAGLKDLLSLHEPPSQPPEQAAAGAPPSFSLEQILRGVHQQQFEPFFQPKVDLATGRIGGAEALARWRHPDHGLVAPYAFIEPLEQSGKIDELTLLMLEKAGSACCAWRGRGLDLTVSVNLSLASLTDTMLADRITQTVHLTGLDPLHMTLEITETAAMTEVAPALENLARLRMRGFGLSVDDYGTGFSSLRQLTRVPFTELKIDRGFVTGCATNPSSRTIIESSVEMTRRLGIKSVAEGVESQSDWDVLETVGCDLAQGYFIARPMDESSFLGYCAARSTP